eukprot:tig00000093_g3593.t1
MVSPGPSTCSMTTTAPWRPLHECRLLSVPAFLDLGVSLLRLLFDAHGSTGSLLLTALRPRNLSVRFADSGAQLRLSSFEADPDGGPEDLEGYIYTAPELTGRTGATEAPDERTDVYLAGIVLYEALAGRPPFVGASAVEILHAHLAKRPQAASRVRPASSGPSPRFLDSILERLLAKAPGERYQSAFGALHDLSEARAALAASGGAALQPFPLASRDRSGRLALGSALYGREAEVEKGLAACRRARDAGRPVLAVVRGPPGAGKTYLAREIGRRALSAGLASRLLAGKADQPPFSAWFRAVESLVGQLLALPEAEAAAWRAALLPALRGNARLLVDVAPAAKLLLRAEPPPLPDLPAPEARERLLGAFEELLRCAASGPGTRPEEGLVLRKRDAAGEPVARPSSRGPPPPSLLVLLDDLQWADGESLALAEALLSAEAPRLPLLLLATVRDAELGAGHPTAEFLERARGRFPCFELAAAFLSREDCCSLVADALGGGGAAAEERVRALGATVLRKTAGNPLHAMQFLRHLEERRVLRFDHPAGRFEWSQAEADAVQEGATVVEMMSLSIRALPEGTQAALRVASCCGAAFDAGSLAAIAGESPSAMLELLRPALAAGLIAPREPLVAPDAGGGEEGPAPPRDALFSFRHDKIQQARAAAVFFAVVARSLKAAQAAHDALLPAERRALCLRAGRLLLASCPRLGRSERLYDVAHLLNAGLPAPGEAAPAPAPAPEDLLSTARADALAAARARGCTAYDRALEYARAGLAALQLWREGGGGGGASAEEARGAEGEGEGSGSDGDERLSSPDRIEFELLATTAECEYLKGGFEEALPRFEAAWRLAAGRRERLRVYRGRVALLSSMGRFRESYEAGIECLDSLWGIRVPPDVTMADFEQEMDALVAALLGPSGGAGAGPAGVADAVCGLPDCTDRGTLEMLSVAGEAALSAGYASASALFGLLPARALRLGLRAGKGPQTAFLASVVGQVCSVIDRLKPYSYPFSEVSIRMMASSPDMLPRVRVSALLWTSISCVWGQPYARSLAYADECLPLAVQSGMVVDAVCVGIVLVVNGFAVERLDAYERRLDGLVRLFSQTRSALLAQVTGPFLATARALRGHPCDEGLGPFAPAPSPAEPLAVELDAARLQADVAALPPHWAKSFYCFASIMRFLAGNNPAAAWRVAEAYDSLAADAYDVRQAVSCEQMTCLALGLALGIRLSPGEEEGRPAWAPPLEPAERARLESRLEYYAARAGVHAATGPQNWLGWHRLLLAERQRAAGAGPAALAAYEAARAAAEAAGVRFVSALCAERAAGLAAECGMGLAAGAYREAAAATCDAWGAPGGAARLRRGSAPSAAAAAAAPTAAPLPLLDLSLHAADEAPHAPGAAAAGAAGSAGERRRASFSSSSRARGGVGGGGRSSSFSDRLGARPGSTSGGGEGGYDPLNWSALVQCSQVLSREIELGRLLERLVAVCIEISGAQRGFLVLEREGAENGAGAGAGPRGGTRDFLVEASGEVEEPEGEGAAPPSGPGPGPAPPAMRLRTLQGVPLRAAGSLLSVRAVEWALCTERPALVHDASSPPSSAASSEEGLDLRRDPYVARAGPLALLALPILHAGRPIACLYLENRLLRGAFTPAVIETLTVLSSQLAISIVNARLYESLQRKANEIGAIFAHDAIVTLDGDLSVVSANPAAERLWRRPLAGQRLEDLLSLCPPAGEEAAGPVPLSALRSRSSSPAASPASGTGTPRWGSWEDLVNRVFGGYALTSEADGSVGRMEVEICVTTLAGGSEVALGTPSGSGEAGQKPAPPGRRFAVFVRDVSARVKAEEQLRRVHRRWFAMITHDLRTPLNGILGMHQLLVDSHGETPFSAEQREYIEHIGSSSNVLLSLMNEILEYSKLEEGEEGGESAVAPFDLAACLEETAALVERTARDAGIELAVRIAGDVPRAVRGDPTAVRRIAMNYLSNAVKFSPRGSRVELRAALDSNPTPGPGPNPQAPPPAPAPARRRSLPAAAAAGCVRVRVSVVDAGAGIPRDLQRLLFIPYQQLPRDGRGHTRMFQGTGLGLAIVRRLAENMGGAAGVLSEPGRGSHFWASFTLERQEGAGPVEWPALAGEPCAVSASSPSLAAFVEYHLGQWGARLAPLGGPGPPPLLVTDGPRPEGFPRCASLAEPRAALRPTLLAQAVAAALGPGGGPALGPAPPAAAPAPAAAPPPPAPPPALRVLLVDDIRTNLLLARRMLEQLGYRVDTAENGEEACARHAEDPGGYGIILLDVEMPVCDGREACRRIRAAEARGFAARVPIVFVTANSLPEDRAEALSLGADDFLTKPIRRQTLAETVQRLFRGS